MRQKRLGEGYGQVQIRHRIDIQKEQGASDMRLESPRKFFEG